MPSVRRAALAIAVLLLGALLWLRYDGAKPEPEDVAKEPSKEAPAEPERPPEPQGPLFRGTVFLANGIHAPHAIVCIRTTTDAWVVAFADDSGDFEARLPHGARPRWVIAEHVPSGTPPNAFVFRAPVPVRFDLKTMTVSGRAVDREHRPVPYAKVEILANVGRGEEVVCDPLLQADREGSFSTTISTRDAYVLCRAPRLRSFRRPALSWLGDVILEPLPPRGPPSSAYRSLAMNAWRSRRNASPFTSKILSNASGRPSSVRRSTFTYASSSFGRVAKRNPASTRASA
jgi:hypothetical protein